MVEKKLERKTDFVSFVFIALMLGSIFAGAVSAESISEDLSAKTILNGTERYDDFDTSLWNRRPNLSNLPLFL